MIVKKALNQLKSLKKRSVVVSLTLFTVLVLTGLELIQDRSSDTPLLNQRAELAVRSIGDQLLRQVGDTKTPVLPVDRLENSTLRLSFKNPVAIQPDSLAQLVLDKITEELATQVMVNVREEASQKVAYALEINREGENVIPCLGRDLYTSNYSIDFVFQRPAQAASNYQLSMMSVTGFALLFLALQGFADRKKDEADPVVKSVVGGFTIDEDRSSLRFENKEIQLTKKELSLISILFANAGKLLSREYLTEQIWSKEGVITGRSLDMFISRLRKKLSVNPKVKITNQHGKGYMLVVE
ncbi:MAG: winged helix-turn-helix transcriptional regulator [Roseivirga sp.]|nr:winged helix-turn-helix transcriptional regulator [Roseivirga sp.]